MLVLSGKRCSQGSVAVVGAGAVTTFLFGVFFLLRLSRPLLLTQLAYLGVDSVCMQELFRV